jgi:acetoacetyl-CoA synthetase
MSTSPLWSPSPERVARTNLTRFMQLVRDRFSAPIDGYESLHRWSTDYPERFWTTLWEFCEIRSTKAHAKVLENPTSMPGARWFVGAELNYAANLLRHLDDSPALVFRNERSERRELSFRQLGSEVARVAQGLRDVGVKSGDRVAGFMPNLPETVIAMLATTSLGAIWSSCSPDFGVAGVLDRFGQIEPKVLFAADGYIYANKNIDSMPTVRGVLEKIKSIAHVVIVPYLNKAARVDDIANATLFTDFGKADAKLEFTPTAFDHPLFIMYSSGTTGAPKCIVHGAGGTLLQHQKEHVLHTDLKRGDRIFYFTTCGWMMWNWLVSSLAAGATLVLYDGSPLHPDPRVLWRLAHEERVTVFGTSPRFLSACEKEGLQPGKDLDLESLRTVLSTGSPLAPESFRYVYSSIKGDVQLVSMSGGTDIISCFAIGCPIAPVYEGEMQCRGLGMKVEIYGEDGAPLRLEKGELVCTAPFPSMPIGFWNDPDGKKYSAAYFERFPNIWCHGDYALLTERGGVVIYGRSDAVLNPGGVRIGTAEIYRQVETIDSILESLAIGQDWQGDVRVVLFVRLRPGLTLDEPLRAQIRDIIRRNCSPRHVPAKIIQVPDLPRTISGKLVELAVRNVVHGKLVKNTDALANPEALVHFRDLPELSV